MVEGLTPPLAGEPFTGGGHRVTGDPPGQDDIYMPIGEPTLSSTAQPKNL